MPLISSLLRSTTPTRSLKVKRLHNLERDLFQTKLVIIHSVAKHGGIMSYINDYNS